MGNLDRVADGLREAGGVDPARIHRHIGHDRAVRLWLAPDITESEIAPALSAGRSKIRVIGDGAIDETRGEWGIRER